MMYLVYILAGLAGGVLTGMAGLTAAMVLTPILRSVCGWSGYDAVTLSLITNVPSAMVICWTFYKNGNIQMKKGMPMAVVAFAGAISHVAMGAAVAWIHSIVVTVMCTISAVSSARFANRVSEKKLNLATGTVLILVSVISWVLSA